MIGVVLRKRLYRPEALGLLARDLLGRRARVRSAAEHLHHAAEWLIRAQRATPDDGVSGGYSFEDGWIASYPETTGYLVPTVLAYAEYAERRDLEVRAIAMARWELGVQHADGGFPGHFVDAAHPPVVFNTGQVVFGLLAAWQATGEGAFLESAVRAGGWLARVQDADGAWRRHDYLGGVHAYNARTAWALVELGTVVADPALLDAATRHLDWVLTQQDEDGWYRSCGFGPGDVPFLHTIAYTSQGLLEAGLRLGRSDYVAAAERTCRAVACRVSPSGAIAGSFDRGWRPVGRSSCLTGNAQMAVQWFRLYETTRDTEYRDVAVRALGWLKALHDCDTRNPNVRGAVKGSHPIWGRYLFGTYPNWAVKFFMDALLLEERVVEGRKACIRCW